MASANLQLVHRLCKSVIRIRMTEEALSEQYKQQQMRTPTHFGVGQEAVAAGVCEALRSDDVVYTHHRSHNHYLAKGGTIRALAAELFGRETGCAAGRGGSVHLTARDKGFIASSAILGQTIAVATGSALAFKMDNSTRISVTFFGEATCEEGVFYESLNYASINRLPVLFVCENNLYSTESPLSVRQPAGTDLCERVKSFKVASERVDGNDVFAVNAAADRAANYLRRGQGPFFLECMTYRWLEHVGPNYDHEMGRSYRSKEELESWMKRCPMLRAREKMIAEGWASTEQFDSWRGEVANEVEDAIAFAKASPWPQVSALFDNVY